jgi:hypothetical protein
MAITATALTVVDYHYPTPAADTSPDSWWAVNATTPDASACEELLAAGAAGKCHYIELLTINAASLGTASTNATYTIGAGETGGNVTAPIIGPVTMQNHGGNLQFDFRPYPIKVAAATALTLDASTAGAVCVFMKGFTK